MHGVNSSMGTNSLLAQKGLHGAVMTAAPLTWQKAWPLPTNGLQEVGSLCHVGIVQPSCCGAHGGERGSEGKHWS